MLRKSVIPSRVPAYAPKPRVYVVPVVRPVPSRGKRRPRSG